MQPDLFSDLLSPVESESFSTPVTSSRPLEGAGSQAAAPVPSALAPTLRRFPHASSDLETKTIAAAVQPSPSATEFSAPSALYRPATKDDSPDSETSPPRWTVSGLVRHVRGLVEGGYARVTVEGEISNWRPAGSGHCYFTLKDADAQISAVLFRRQASLLRFRPTDGDAVRLHGQLSIYESRGQLQIIAEWVEQVGFGAVLAALQRLKERLRGEGLFDRKRQLPPFPRCIGVITSLQGAALRDIVKVCRRRHAAVQLLIYPAAVQGPNCATEIAVGLRWFNAHPDRAEVLLVARGGGSWEDLHGFDDEAVVRAIAASTLPVITGLGHATDSTLADLAADLCAPTPSAAAELLTSAQHRVEEHIDRLATRLRRVATFEVLRARQRFARLGTDTVLRRVEDSLNRRGQRIDELGFRNTAAGKDRLARTSARLRQLQARLGQQNPAVRLAIIRRRLDPLPLRLAASAQQQLEASSRRLERATGHLGAMSPLRVLERGYALVFGPDGQLLCSAEAAQSGDQITARLASGTLTARVLG